MPPPRPRPSSVSRPAPRLQTMAELLGHTLRFEASPGLFSADRVDDGTRLLLEALPSGAPRTVLDLGCGYGALGLPVAAHFPEARCLLVDRQTQAVAWAARNAATNRLANVEVKPGLGFRELTGQRFDWVLCNIPARIGPAALEYLVDQGARHLTPGGELRIVVIRDLAHPVETMAGGRGWPLRRVHEGPRHAVFALGPLPDAAPVDHEAIYVRDETTQEGLSFERPQDISEDPAHVSEGLPLLLELLPRQRAGKTLVWRGGYGIAAVTLARRGNAVLAADPDLLATAFSVRNGRRHRVALTCAEGPSLAEAVGATERFALVAGELSPSQEVAEAAADLAASVERLAPGGQALWLAQTRSSQPVWKRAGPTVRGTLLASRAAFSVWRLTKQAAARGRSD